MQIIGVWGQGKDIDLRFPIPEAGLFPPSGSVNEPRQCFPLITRQWHKGGPPVLYYRRDSAKHFCQNQTQQNTMECFVTDALPHQLT